VLIINHPGKIRISYEPVVHFLGCCVRQSARLIDIKRVGSTIPPVVIDVPSSSIGEGDHSNAPEPESNDEIALATGDRAICRFRFLYRPEHIFMSTTSDNAMVMREGRTKGVGKVLSLGSPASSACTTPQGYGKNIEVRSE
jgi:GTPase